MLVRWMTAFLDLPAHDHAAGTAFWCAVTGSTPSPARGDDGEFATLLPPDGDAYLKVQRVGEGPARVHLDVHVDDVTAAAADLVALGAEVVRVASYVVLRSPAGLVFCLVSHRTGGVRPAPQVGPRGARSRVDQLCVDVPAPAFAAECAFWSAATGWDLRTSGAEFASLVRPADQPLRILLQRLGPDDGATSARAHLDVACGADGDALVAQHETLGARVIRRPFWTTLVDPAGLPYCLTPRDPDTGLLPARYRR